MIAVEFGAVGAAKDRENLTTTLLLVFQWLYGVSKLPVTATSRLGKSRQASRAKPERAGGRCGPATPSVVAADRLEFQARYRS